MRPLWLCFLVAAGCSNGSGGDLPVNPGGTPDGGALPDAFIPPDGVPGGSVDAMPGAINGRVCLAADPRALTQLVSPTACATTGAGGLTVSLGGTTATTNADGTFSILPPTTSGTLVWGVSGPNIVPSRMLFSDYEIPALSTATFAQLLSDNAVTLLPGEGSIFVQIVRNGAGYVGVTAATSPSSNYDAFYDGASATAWTQTSTGSFGTVWFPGLDIGDATATVKATDGAGTSLTTAAQPIVPGGITFIDIVYP